MSLNLALVISADAKAVAPATAEARREIESVGKATSVLTAANDAVAASHRRAMEAAAGRAQAERDLRAAAESFAGVRPVLGDEAYAARKADIEAYATALDELKAKYNPVFAIERQRTAQLAEINQALRLGAINEREHAAAVQIATAAYDVQAAAAQRLTTATGAGAASTKLAAHEVQILAYQANDFVTGLLSGQSFGIVMAQQGLQASQVLGPRGLGQIVPALGQAFVSLLSPTTLALAAITAGGYAAVYAFGLIQGEVEEANLSVEEHTELIDRVVKRWGAAVPELKAYNDELQRTKDIEEALKALRLTAVEQYNPAREALPQLQVNRGDISSILSTQGVDSEALRAFNTAFDELERKIADSTATAEDAVRVQKALTDANIFGNDILKGYADQFGNYADQVRRASEEAQKFRTLQDGGTLFGRNNQPSILSPIDPLDGFNRTPFQREDQIQDERARRQREAEENKRLGGLAPVPTPRPNLEDVLPSARDFIVSQEEQLERLRVERTLIGATTAERERAIAALEAETEIRRRGIDAQGQEAESLRRNAAAIADATTELERHEAAWKKAQRAGESMIDTIFDRLSSGDIEGLLGDLSKTLSKELFSLAAGGVKNAIYGTDYPTAQDYGGFAGFFGALFGQRPGGGSNVTRLLPAGNDNFAVPQQAGPLETVVRMPLAAVGSRQAYRDAIASIESAGSGDYAAIGPTHPTMGRALGRYQIMEANIGSWSRAALGRPVGVSEFMDSSRLQDAIFDHRFGSYVDRYGERGAAQAWFGGPGSVGKLGRMDVLGTSVGGYGEKFVTALERMGGAGEKASAALDVVASGSLDAGKGLGAFGQSLAQIGNGQGGGDSGLGGLFGKLFGGGSSFFPPAPTLGAGMSSWFMTGLFDAGGYTGAGDPADVAGFVHRDEFVFSSPATRQIGRANLEALHKAARGGGFRDGGYVEGGAPAFGTGRRGDERPGPTIVFENRGTAQRVVQEREEGDGQGGRRMVYVLDDAFADQVGRAGSATQRRLRGMGVRTPVVRT